MQRGVFNPAYQELLDWLKTSPREGPDADPLWPMENGGVRIQSATSMGELGSDPAVVGISVHDALAFCHWLNHSQGPGFRLPTEDEWEWAVRGPTGERFLGVTNGRRITVILESEPMC